MDAAERFAADEAFEGFDTEGKFTQSQGALAAKAAGAQAVEVFGQSVFRARAIDDAEVFAAATFDAGLNDAETSRLFGGNREIHFLWKLLAN